MSSKQRESSADANTDIGEAAPSWLWSLIEAPRAVSEAGSLIPASQFLKRLPEGDGHAVMTVPGFMASDRSTRPLRQYLRSWGYDAYRWDLGRNIGVIRDGDLEGALDERLLDLYNSSGQKVSLVGWSLGGLLAREVARRNRKLVRNVITLGSPLGDPKLTTLWRVFEFLAGVKVTDAQISRRTRQLRKPIQGVPTTAIYSRTDAVVSHRIARLPAGRQTESIGIAGSHLGMGFNPVVLYAIADRLRQEQGSWQPFDKSGLRCLFYS